MNNDTSGIQQKGWSGENTQKTKSRAIKHRQSETKAGRKKIEIKEGQVFGRLTAICALAPNKKHQTWMFRCECGTEKPIRVSHVVNGCVISCSCLQGKKSAARLTTHGLTYSPEYSTWTRMKCRCYNKRDISYPNYGGRGITVCDRWLNSFKNFISDMGGRPSKYHSLDRIDCNAPYAPNNCRWATRLDQANNTRKNRFLTFNGRTLTVAQWSKLVPIKAATLLYRKKHGWDDERCLTTVKLKV